MKVSIADQIRCESGTLVGNSSESNSDHKVKPIVVIHKLGLKGTI